MKKIIGALGCAMLVLVFAAGTASAKVSKGQKEISFFGSLVNTSPDSGDSSTTTILQVSGGVFISDPSQVGGSVILVSTDSGGVTTSVTLLNAFFKYHINPQSETVPYVGGQVGFAAAESGGFSDSGLSFGGMVGAKFFLSENLSVNPEFNLLHSTLFDVSVTQTTLQIGLSYYF
ncbi:MAG TPA: outer membrane beta-barrel protein [bacterium]|nr:outer membrane beta-barrel protein [bacterium]